MLHRSTSPRTRCASARSCSTSGASTAAARRCERCTRTTGPRPPLDHGGLQGAPARHRGRRPGGHAELQPPQGAAVLVLPDAGARLHRRRVPLVRRLRERSGGVLAHAAVQGQDRPARVALRVLPRAGDARVEELRAAVGRAGRCDVAHLAPPVRLEQRRHVADVRLDELRHRRAPRSSGTNGRRARVASS